jgi:hypothetical protein
MFNYEVMDHGFKFKCNMEPPKKFKLYKTNHPMFTNHPIATTHRMYSHVKRTIAIGFVLIKDVFMVTHHIVPIVMTLRNATTMVFASTTLPSNLGLESLDLPRGSRITRRFVVPSICPYRRSLNYFEYKNILMQMVM